MLEINCIRQEKRFHGGVDIQFVQVSRVGVGSLLYSKLKIVFEPLILSKNKERMDKNKNYAFFSSTKLMDFTPSREVFLVYCSTERPWGPNSSNLIFSLRIKRSSQIF